MDKSSFELIKVVGMYDFVIGILISIILLPFLNIQSCNFALGILCGFINFIINAFTTKQISKDCCKSRLMMILLSYGVRIALVCGIGITLAKVSIVSFIVFIVGYSAQLLSILLYGLRLVKAGESE